jgi:ABC-type multidrug transport system permease subunit
MAHYVPPKQSKLSQLIDVIVLVALTVGALFVPLWLGMAGSSKTVATPVETPTWEALGQNAVQAAQYEALGYTPETAHDLILARFDYSFTAGALITMIVVIVAYYFLMLKFSETEYREVISEKFGDR